MDDKTFIGKRRDRAIATILSYKEDACDDYLPELVSRQLRKVVLDQINELCDLAFDCMGEDPVNEYYLDRLDAIMEKVGLLGRS